jgi:hypothetical protein
MFPSASVASSPSSHRFRSLSTPVAPTKTVLLTGDPQAADPVAAKRA